MQTRAPGFLAAGGDLGALMRGRDWSATPLGPPEAWPAPLQVAVSRCLDSRYPIVLWAGPELTTLYNDAYAALLGDRHPHALGAPGREVFPGLWDVVGPLLARLLERGSAAWGDDRLLMVDAAGADGAGPGRAGPHGVLPGMGRSLLVPLDTSKDRHPVLSIACVVSPDGPVDDALRRHAERLAGAIGTVVPHAERRAREHRQMRASEARAQRAELALDEEHAIAETLQRSMLPDGFDDIGDFVELAARYEPAHATMRIGGDFYDAVPLADGRLLLAVGDVAGHGLLAATIMGETRAALRTLAVRDEDPGRLLAQLNAVLVHRRRAPMVTCQLVVVEPDGRSARYATAGHPPAIACDPEGTSRLLDDAGGPPLGVRTFAQYPVATVDLEPETTLLLYTDGLFERRGESVFVGIDRLADTLCGHLDGSVEATADALLASERGMGFEDDVALLVVALHQPGPALRLALDARTEALSRLRSSLTRWLRANGVGERDAQAIVLACHEAAANVVQHAYGLREGTLLVDARRDADEVVIAFTDEGAWRPRREDEGGRGLDVMGGLMDAVDVHRTESGSRVELRRRIHHEETA